MTLYRAVLSPRSPLASPLDAALQSDTLFGAFCWSWLRCFGTGSLEAELISPSLTGEPPVIFSNGFPQGCLPVPLGCRDMNNDFNAIQDKRERRKAYQEGKKIKKARYVSLDDFQRIRRGNWRGFTDSLKSGSGKALTTLHNTVSRESGTVERTEETAGLFGLDRQYFDNGQRFDCYLLSSLPVDILRKVLDLMCSLGIGADKSAGCGVFGLESLETAEELSSVPDGANGVVMLSNFLPAKTDPTDGWYQVLPKYPKLDRELAAGETPFKKPVLFFKAGAFFRTEAPKTWYGRCVSRVAALDLPVTMNGCAIAATAVIPGGI